MKLSTGFLWSRTAGLTYVAKAFAIEACDVCRRGLWRVNKVETSIMMSQALYYSSNHLNLPNFSVYRLLAIRVRSSPIMNRRCIDRSPCI